MPTDEARALYLYGFQPEVVGVACGLQPRMAVGAIREVGGAYHFPSQSKPVPLA